VTQKHVSRCFCHLSKLRVTSCPYRIGIVSDPQTGPLYTRVRDLYDAGVGIALGQGDIADVYYPFGRNNMLEVAFLRLI
jgi:cytosine deaminase